MQYPHETYKLSRNVLRISRGEGLVLVNTLKIRPLLVKTGVDYVLETLNAIERGQPSSAEPDLQLLDTLAAHGIIVRRDVEEAIPFADYTYDPAKEKAGMSLYFLLSQRCNLRCRYCFADAPQYRKETAMTFRVAKAALQKALGRIRPKGGKLSLVFFGGEPLLNWGLAKDIVAYVEEDLKPLFPRVTFNYHITTNLYRLPADFVTFVKQHNMSVLTDVDGHIPEVHDSLRPSRSGHGTFQTIVENIRTLRKHDVRLEVRSTICASNQSLIYDITQFLKEVGGKGAVLELTTAFNSMQKPLPEELLPDVEQYIKDVLAIYEGATLPVENIFPINKMFEKIRSGEGSALGCGMPWGNINIVDAEGDVYMCTFLVGQEKYRLGSVFDEGRCYAHEKEAVEGAFKSVHVDLVEECRSCEWKYICTGHCPIARLAIEANEKQGSPVPSYVKRYCFQKSCVMTKTFYERLLWDLASNNLPEPVPSGPEDVSAALCT